MLIKLIKTDLRCTARSFVPVCLGLLVLAVAMIGCMVMIPTDNTDTHDVAFVTLIVAYIICMVALFVFSGLAFLIPMLRFRRCVMSNDAYLMLTIPIRPSLHIASKLICSVVWYMAAQLCKAIVTGIMIASDKDNKLGIGDLFKMFTIGRDEEVFTADNILYILMGFFNSLLLIITAQLFLYLVFVIASMSNKNKGLLSVLMAIGGSVLLSWGYGVIFVLSLRMVQDGDLIDYATSGMRYVPSIIYYAVLSIAFYLGTSYILDHKYNLQ